MKIGFIGAGNMASAIIKAVVNTGYLSGKDIFAYNPHRDKAEILSKETGITVCSSNSEVVEKSDFVFLAVKPHLISTVLKEVSSLVVNEHKLIVSIAAGISIEKLEQEIRKDTPIVRVMPNINLVVGEGATALCGNSAVSREQIEFLLGLFCSAGMAVELEEKNFSTFAAIAGSSPAYAYLFIDSLARAAVKYGMQKDIATKIAAQAVLGSAKMVIESSEVPWALVDKVCSPGGTTIAGLLALEEEKFIATVVKGIDATIAREKVISES